MHYFTEEEKQEAKDVNLVELLNLLGIPLQPFGFQYKHGRHDSLNISAHNGWKWHSNGLNGNAVDYLMDGPDFHYCFYDAVAVIRETMGLDKGKSHGETLATKSQEVGEGSNHKERPHKDLALPPRYTDNRKVSAYLNQGRGIDYEFINRCIKHDLLYESADKHNAVFIGKDFEGNEKYAFQRGSNTFVKFVNEVEGSNKAYSFRLDGTSETIRVFESPIDALSYLTLVKIHKKVCNDTLLSLGGISTTALSKFLKESNTKITKIAVCTDNDEAGKTALETIQKKYSNKYKIIDNRPKDMMKDYNEQLLQVLELQKKKGLER